MKSNVLCAMLMLGIPALVFAEDGYVFGDSHCFYFSSPTGWSADHLSGKSRGLPFVFYPTNSNWSSATTVIYARVADKSQSVNEPKDQVASTLEQFHTEYESPNSSADKVGTIKARSNATGELYEFTGDKWGNTELVVYFNGRETINFFVMTSRDKKDLEINRRALEELAVSYREASDCVPCDEPNNTSSCKNKTENLTNLPTSLSEAKKLGDYQEKADISRDYHSSVLMPYFGRTYADVFKRCFDTISNPDDQAFDFVVAFDADGNVLRVYRNLETNVFQCINDDLVNDRFPKPPVAPYFLSIEMKFTS